MKFRSPGLKKYEGKTVAELAAEQGKDGVDAFLDLTLADDLQNEFTMKSFNSRADRMAEILNNKDMLLGLGDGGAHLDMLCDSGYPTYVLGTWVRERKVLTLEEAVRRMTSDPGGLLRHPGSRPDRAGHGRRPRDLRSRDASAPAGAPSASTTCRAARSAW